MIWLWTAFLVGFAGSIHCIGMCGPIALALPRSQEGKLNLLIGRSLYNSGRILTYGLIGGIAGIAGKSLFLAGAQQWVSIMSGALLILSVLIPVSFSGKIQSSGPINFWNQFVKRNLSKILSSKNLTGMFGIGLLNGFLPCGLVYVGLAGALNTGQIGGAVLYMVLFGLGTFPVMLAVSLFGQFISSAARRRISKVVPAFLIILGLLFILRGMNMGVKYISPELRKDAPVEKMEECH